MEPEVVLDQAPSELQAAGTPADPAQPAQTQARSCFLPSTAIQYAWDSTSLGLIKTCPRLYQYTMIEGWTGRNDNIHLRFGIEYHKALQDYDDSRSAGIDHDDAVHDVVRALLTRITDWTPQADEAKKSERLKTKEALVRTTVWHLEKFKDDQGKTYQLANGKPATELSFRFELEWGPEEGIDAAPAGQPFILCGHLDRVVSYADSLFVMDYKTTTAGLTDYYFRQYEPNNQMTLYTLAAQVVLQAPVKGVIVSGAQIGEGWAEFERRFTYRTPDQLEEWLGDLRILLAEAEGYATTGYWPMRDTSCDKYGGCRFREICSKSPQVRRNFLKSDFVQLPEEERWDPLKPR